MDKIIGFKPKKIVNLGEIKVVYRIEDSRLFEIDDKLEQILALSGHSVEELFNRFAKEKNIEIEETKNLLQMIYDAGLVLDSNSDETESENM